MVKNVVSSLKTQWAFGLWVIIFVGVLVFGLAGDFVVTRLGYRPLPFWHYWEFAGLVSTIVFNIFFYLLGFFLPPRMFLHLKNPAFIGVIILLELISIACLYYATLFSLKEKSCLFQLSSILIVAVSFWALDSVMARQSKNKKISDDFQASVILNDKPAFLAFGVLFLLSWLHPGSHWSADGGYEPTFRAFIGGAIAFQMIVSNSVLALIFRRPGEWQVEDAGQ